MSKNLEDFPRPWTIKVERWGEDDMQKYFFVVDNDEEIVASTYSYEVAELLIESLEAMWQLERIQEAGGWLKDLGAGIQTRCQRINSAKHVTRAGGVQNADSFS